MMLLTRYRSNSAACRPTTMLMRVLDFNRNMPAAIMALLLACTGTTHLRAGESETDESRHALVDAAESQNFEEVRWLLDAGVSVDERQVDGMTALLWACYHEDSDMVDLLIRNGADPNDANRYGVRPLNIACQNGDTRTVVLLLRAGANPNAKLRGGETSLMTASRTGRVEAVDELIAHGAELDATERHNQTAIMWAAAEGHATVVARLIEAGADFQTPLSSGFTPMFFAVREGHASVVKLFLEAGIDVNSPMESQRGGPIYPIRGTSPLVLAIENGHFDLALELLDAGADPNDQRTGFTPLHVLTWVRKPNRGDGADGSPPPIGSGELTSLELIHELVAHGADVNRQLDKNTGGGLNTKGATPFLMASSTADIEMMQALHSLGADPFIPNVKGSTSLMAAAGLGTRAPFEEAGTEPEALAAVEWLIALGLDVNAVNEDGETCMHGAAYKNLPEVVRLLHLHGAEIEIWNLPNRNRWTPLHIAEGFRPGNFKPSHETIAALHEIFRDNGLEPPPPTDREAFERNDY